LLLLKMLIFVVIVVVFIWLKDIFIKILHNTIFIYVFHFFINRITQILYRF
jgi:hypothetical protein